MKLVDKMLQANEEALIWSDAQRENRLRSIAMNACQQARFPFGRGDDPFTDADAQVANDVFLILLRLERKAEIVPEQQHQLLTPVAKPDSDAILAEVAKIITHPRDLEFGKSHGLVAIGDLPDDAA